MQKRIDEYIKNAAVASAVAVTCIGITGCGSKVEKITDYMDNADYEKALEVYSGWKNVSEEEKEKLADAMRERLEQAAAGFGAGTMELEQAMEIYETIDQMNMDELSGDEIVAYSRIQTVKDSREMYAAGNEALDGGEYLEAISCFRQVSELDCNYASAVRRAKAAEQKYIDAALETARGYADEGNYESAYSYLKSAGHSIEDTSVFEEEILALHKQEALATAAALADGEEYTEALAALDTYKETYDAGDTEISEAYDGYVRDYVTQKLEEAEEYREKGQYLTAADVLEKAKGEVEAPEFDETIARLKNEKPVYLEDLEQISSYKFERVPLDEERTDVHKKVYIGENAYELAATAGDGWSSDSLGSVEFKLGRRYTNLSGVIAVDSNSGSQTAVVKIEGDGTELYSGRFTESSYGETISIDVKLFNTLKIYCSEIDGDGSIYLILSDFTLTR